MTDTEAEEYFWTVEKIEQPTSWRYRLLRLLGIED